MATVRKVKSTYKGASAERWAVVYRDGSGTRRMQSPATGLKKDADKLRLKIEREIEDGLHVADADTRTVGQVCEEYLRQMEDKRRDARIGPSWQITTKTAIERQIVPTFGATRVIDLKPAVIEKWFSAMRRGGSATSTAKQKLYIFGQIEAFALKRGYLKTRPVGAAAQELRGIKGAVIRTFTSEEVLRLLAAARQRPRRFTARGGDFLEAAVNIAAFCGLRFGEVMALSLDTVDLDQRVFRVRHSLTRWDVLKAPKTQAGVRDVPIPTHVALMVRDWIAKHYVPNDRGLIFRTASGGAYNGGNFHNNDWGPLLVRAGLREGERFHFHALRHFAASWMIEHGLPLTDVASLLGHSKFDMTLQVYAHPVVGGNRRHEAMDRMASALVAAPLLIEATKEQRSPLSV